MFAQRTALALLMGGASAGVVTSKTRKDCGVLIDMHKEMNGPSWGRSWDVAQKNTCCSWPGISCATQGKEEELRVDKIDLNGEKSITGTLPWTITKLDQLKKARLHWTGGLSGTLPADIGKLKNLEYLKLGRNEVSGTIPDSFYQLAELDTLYLKQTDISGTISGAIGTLTDLSFLDLSEAKFKGTLPNAISSLTKLETFIIEDNAWEGWLPELPSSITECDLSDRHFDDPYSVRQAKPIHKSKFGDRNAHFNCPLPTTVPKACEDKVYCTTTPMPHPGYGKDAAGGFMEFISGTGSGVGLMLLALVVVGVALFLMRKKLFSKPLAASSSASSATTTDAKVDVHPANERAY